MNKHPSQAELPPIRVGLLGIGTVGGGTFDVLRRNQEEIVRRVGRAIVITHVADLDVERARGMVGAGVTVTNDGFSLVSDPSVDVVIELVGGYGVAKQLVLKAIEHGKHVVTANKALLATHGNEIFAAARTKGVIVAFEAAVAGGIPIIKAMREGLSANRLRWVAGIINGTTNFILTEMRDKGLSFATALAEAQRLGYAEADPTFDIEGVDAAHKISLLASLAFGVPIQFEKAHIEGISALQAADIRYAEQLGYRIKLLGIAKRVAHIGSASGEGIELRVHPTLIPTKRLIANVEGAMNAVMVNGDAVGTTMYYGKGAGSEPTGSAVIADLIDVARAISIAPNARVPALAFQFDSLADTPVLPIADTTSSYYLRIPVSDKPGVLADITRILADAGISIDALLQREAADGQNQTEIILLTHVTTERQILGALARIATLTTVVDKIVRLRLESLKD
jgi:homoserine dehydrogenase